MYCFGIESRPLVEQKRPECQHYPLLSHVITVPRVVDEHRFRRFSPVKKPSETFPKNGCSLFEIASRSISISTCCPVSGWILRHCDVSTTIIARRPVVILRLDRTSAASRDGTTGLIS
jgi:hypothetical protein